MGPKPANRFTSADDDIDDGTQATSVVVTSSSSDSDYNGLSQVLSCSTEDNDSAGVSVSITSSNVTEGGVSATASVVLDSEPVSTVTVSLGVDTSDLALNKTTLTFNSANWDSTRRLQFRRMTTLFMRALKTVLLQFQRVLHRIVFIRG